MKSKPKAMNIAADNAIDNTLVGDDEADESDDDELEPILSGPQSPAHVCLHCHRDPPDGMERASAYGGAWLHPQCEEAFIQARMAEEGLLHEQPIRPPPPPPPPPRSRHLRERATVAPLSTTSISSTCCSRPRPVTATHTANPPTPPPDRRPPNTSTGTPPAGCTCAWSARQQELPDLFLVRRRVDARLAAGGRALSASRAAGSGRRYHGADLRGRKGYRDRGARHGFIATTNPGGAGKWRPELTPYFQGKQRVCIVEDNDTAGAKHTAMVLKALRGVVPTIGVMRFPELPPGGDLSDYFERGNSKAGLQIRIEEALKTGVARPYVVTHLHEYVPEALDWIWEGHLPVGALELLTGAPGIGKSLLQCDLIAILTTGRNWPDGKPGPTPGRVVILTAEDRVSDYVRRLTAAGADLTKTTMLSYVRRNERDELFLLGRGPRQARAAGERFRRRAAGRHRSDHRLHGSRPRLRQPSRQRCALAAASAVTAGRRSSASPSARSPIHRRMPAHARRWTTSSARKPSSPPPGSGITASPSWR